MKKVFVSRPIFPDVIERLKQYFEVDAHGPQYEARVRIVTSPSSSSSSSS